MTDIPRECTKCRPLLREYVLGTLRPALHDRLKKHIATCAGCTGALAAEREALAALDKLEPVEPSRDLTAAVMERVRSAEEAERGRTPAFRIPAFAYQVAVLVAAVGILAVLMPALSRAREAARRASSANNLKQMGLIFKMYANENDGKFPPLAPYKGVWMVDFARLYPEYVSDMTIFVNPRLSDYGELVEQMNRLLAEPPIDWEKVTRIAAKSYTYTNWVIQDDTEVEQLKEGYMQLAKADYDTDLQVDNQTFYRLREGVERFMIIDINNPAASAMAQSEVPVMFETMHDGEPQGLLQKEPGYNVMYMDGHVEFIRYEEKFPATATVADAFRSPQP
jgi:prepilin-type processing-associated H-X9-DG protein